jgi:hypothetical protein
MSVSDKIQLFLGVVQTITLIVIALNVIIANQQKNAALDQAAASNQLAALSSTQTSIMRNQLEATYKPVLSVTGTTTSGNTLQMTVQNSGPGAALSPIMELANGKTQTMPTIEAGRACEQRIEIPDMTANNNSVRIRYSSLTGAHLGVFVPFIVQGGALVSGTPTYFTFDG